MSSRPGSSTSSVPAIVLGSLRPRNRGLAWLGWGGGALALAGLVATAVVGVQSIRKLERQIATQDTLLLRGESRLLSLKKKLSGADVRGDLLLRLHGSNTVGDELAPLLVQGWLAEMGGREARIVRDSSHPEKISVQASMGLEGSFQKVDILARGSGVGFDHLRDGSTDLGMSSRPVSDEDLEKFEGQGILDMAPPGSEHVIGLDAIAVVVHPGNPATALNMEQLREVFSGKVSDWTQLGVGMSGPIHLVGRDASSGTRSFFKELVLRDLAYPAGLTECASHAQVSAKVMDDPQAIGYVSLPFVGKAKALALRDGNGPPVYPAPFAVRAEDYPLSRRLYLYGRGQGTSLLAREFLEYAMGPAGQVMVEKAGFIPLVIEVGKADAALGDRLPAALREQLRNCERLSSTFRFASEGKLDSRATRDMERLRGILAQQPGTRIYFVGFTDSTSNPEQDLENSRKLAETLQASWLKDGGNPNVQVLSGGSWHPMATNATEAGRLRNRRVEVWIRAR